MLDRRRHVNQTPGDEQMKDKGTEYQQTSGVGKIEQTAGRDQSDQ